MFAQRVPFGGGGCEMLTVFVNREFCRKCKLELGEVHLAGTIEVTVGEQHLRIILILLFDTVSDFNLEKIIFMLKKQIIFGIRFIYPYNRVLKTVIQKRYF